MVKPALFGIALATMAVGGITNAYATENYVVILAVATQPHTGTVITQLPYDNPEDCKAAASHVPQGTKSGDATIFGFCVSNTNK
jgi:hypothetical protein